MNLFLLFIFAHLLGDFPLQGNWVYHQKRKSFLGGLWHAAVLAACFAVIILPYLADRRFFIAIAILAAVHFLQDYCKLQAEKKCKRITPLSGLLIDQAAHLVFIAGSTFHLSSLDLGSSWADWGVGDDIVKYVAIYLIALLLSTFVWDTIRHILRGDKILQRQWGGLLLRGGVVSLVFAATWLIAALG